MTGILVPTSTGLILGETCESYLNGWTFARSGSTTAVGSGVNLAHAGSGAFQIESLSSWPASAYGALTKTVNVLTGANRVARVFRGPPILASIYDDFPGTTLDTNKWVAYSGCSVDVSGGILHIVHVGASYALDSVGLVLPLYQTIVFRAKFGGGYVYPYLGNDGNIQLMLYAGHMYLTTYQGGQSSPQIDCGAVDSNFHTWRIVWSAGACTLYKDDVQVGQTTTKIPTVTGGSFHIEPDGSGMWFDWWGFLGNTDHYKASLKVGSQTITDKDVQIDNSALNGGYFDSGWVVLTQTGSQTVELKFRNASAAAEAKSAQCTWDDPIIMLDTIITIHGLLGGQKVELYDSAGSLRKTGTCPQTGVDVTLTGIDALISTAYGFSGYFKVYDTDGTTLLYTTATAACWGGDVYTWIPNQSALSIITSQTQIYRTGSGLSPTTATLTVTLTNKDTGTPLSGKTIVWTPNLGTCNPTSGATDANGMASTTYTAGPSAGLGGVRADFLGDATYGASGIQQLIDLYYAALTVDATKDFQVWIEGQEAVIASGNYKLSTDFRPQAFSFTTPSLDLTVGGWWAVEIYRRGVKEFKGRIWKKSKKSGMNPTLTVTGVDEVVMLQRRVANEGYTDEPKNIILDLLQRYPCGIVAGTIATYGNTIKLDATYENLFDACQPNCSYHWLEV